MESLAGQSLGQGELASVTTAPTSGLYGFTLSPSSLILTDGCGSTAKFSFGRYADLSVADGSSTYLDRAAYAAALELWRETGPDRWVIVPQSGPSGNDGMLTALALEFEGRQRIAPEADNMAGRPR